jgi:hypothetical protein
MQRIIRSFLLLLSTTGLVTAQGLQNHIPSYAQYVITLNAASYSPKVDMHTISKMEFFNPIKTDDSTSVSVTRLVTTLLSKPADCGANLNPQAYLFRIDHDSVAGWCYLFGLKDPLQFSTFLQNSLVEKGRAKAEITRNAGINKLQSGKVTAAWTKDYVLLLVRDEVSRYAYTEDYYAASAASASEAAKADSIAASIAVQIQREADSLAQVEATKQAESLKKKSGALKKKLPQKKKTKQELVNEEAETMAQAMSEAEHQSMAADSAAIADSTAATNGTSQSYSSGNSDWEKKEKERQDLINALVNERCFRRVTDIINLDPAQSVSKVRSFAESQKEKFDFAFWMNYSGEVFQGLNPFGGRRSRGMQATSPDTANALTNLLKDNYSVAYCNFEAGKLNLVNKAYVNPEMDKLVSAIYKKKGNKNVCKYIKGENLMGYASMSINVEQLLKATRSILIKTYEETMGKDAKYITGMMDIAAIFTNDDVTNNLFKGDFTLAITDLRPFKTSFLSYSYDDNFNRSETKQEKTEVLPEFVAMATVGKPEEMRKILKAVEKMGGLRAEAPGVYLVEIPGKSGYKIYIALSNNILFCTNNEELVHGKLHDGYPKNQQMSKEQRDLIGSWPIAYYWNGSKTFDLINKQPELKSSDKLSKGLNLFKDNLKDAQITGVKHEGNAYITNMTMNFSDASVNSLFSLCKVMNSFYLLEK